MADPSTVLITNLRRLREERNLTQEEVGTRASMAQSQYARIERGDVDPTVRTLKRLATALGVSVSDLVEGL